MRLVQTAPGPVWLELDGGSAGWQRFTAPSLGELLTEREFPRGSLIARLSAAGVLKVSGASDTPLGTSANVQLLDDSRPDFAAMKAARHAAIVAAHAAVDFGTLLCGYRLVPPRRPATLAWLRATPVEQWPPIRVTLCDDGSPVLTDGHHRVAVARELGVRELPALVRTAAGVVDRAVGVSRDRV